MREEGEILIEEFQDVKEETPDYSIPVKICQVVGNDLYTKNGKTFREWTVGIRAVIYIFLVKIGDCILQLITN